MRRLSAALGGTAAERLRAMLIAYALTMLDDFGKCVSRTQDHLLGPESRNAFRKLKREIDTMIREVVIEGGRDGSLAATDPRIATFTLAGALNALGEWYDPTGPLTAEEVAEASVTVLMSGLLPREGAEP